MSVVTCEIYMVRKACMEEQGVPVVRRVEYEVWNVSHPIFGRSGFHTCLPPRRVMQTSWTSGM